MESPHLEPCSLSYCHFYISVQPPLNLRFLISLFHFMPRTTLLRPTKLITLFFILSLINFRIFHQGLILNDPISPFWHASHSLSFILWFSFIFYHTFSTIFVSGSIANCELLCNNEISLISMLSVFLYASLFCLFNFLLFHFPIYAHIWRKPSIDHRKFVWYLQQNWSLSLVPQGTK